MTYNFTVSPDFNPTHLSGWFIFNTWLQRTLGEGIHLELYNDTQALRQTIANDGVDLIYANPFEATTLVRDKGFVSVASPAETSDEAIIAVQAESSINQVEQLQPGARIAATADPDVRRMSMIMLEPADLQADNVLISQRDTYVQVAKDLIQGNADIGFFLAETYHDLSRTIQQQLRPLVSSQIRTIRHVLLVGPRLAHRREDIQKAVLSMASDSKGEGVLSSLSMRGWEAVEPEDMEFMIDLMDTLEK